MTVGTQSWHERLWRANNVADIARSKVPGAKPFAAFGERITSGASTDHILWETGMPNTLTVPDEVQMSLVSSGTDTRRLRLSYLDGGLAERQETVTLNGTTPILTTATDVRFVNALYSTDGPADRTVTMSNGGTTYARLNSGDVQFSQAMYRVPAGRRLMVNTLYAGSASGSAAAKTIVKTEVSFFNGEFFDAPEILYPVGGVALQDSAVSLPFGPIAVPAGEIVALTFKADKSADIVGGFFGWTEPT